jgi:SAM-dependent methyltransferase
MEYNPDGEMSASQYQFPYSPEKFDFVVLVSVFTHMLDEDVRNYIGEIARVLRAGGRCFASFYLLNENTKQGIAAGTSAFAFSIPYRSCWIANADSPDGAVAHEESRVIGMVAAAGLILSEPISYGGWERHGQQAQDVVVFEKPLSSLPADFNSE